jgi:hypothetical protein
MVKFKFDASVNEANYNVDSLEISPLRTKASESEWLLNLSQGDEVDAYDNAGTWREGTVVEPETRPDYEVPIIKVGFRRYSQQGEKTDEMGKYDGFGTACDEFIPAYSARIQKPDTFSKNKPDSSKSQDSKKVNAMDEAV